MRTYFKEFTWHKGQADHYINFYYRKRHQFGFAKGKNAYRMTIVIFLRVEKKTCKILTGKFVIILKKPKRCLAQ